MTGPRSAMLRAGGHKAVAAGRPRPVTGDGWGLVDVARDLAMRRALDVSFTLPTPLATVSPLPDWQAPFGAIQARTAVKALLDPRSGGHPPDDKGATP